MSVESRLRELETLSGGKGNFYFFILEGDVYRDMETKEEISKSDFTQWLLEQENTNTIFVVTERSKDD